jgi:hypothetical protein
LADVAPLSYPPHVFDVQADDLGGGNVRIKVNGVFPDPNLQIRIGNTQRPIDFRSTDGKNLEIIASASTLLNAPNIDLVNAYGNTWPLVIPATDSSKCGVDSVSAHEFPNSDGTATVAVDVTYGKDRELNTINRPIVLLGSTAYGLRDPPTSPGNYQSKSVISFMSILC